MSLNGLLISSDVEVGAYKPEKSLVQTIIPPAFFTHVLEVKPLFDLRGDTTKPVFINAYDGEILWFQDGALFEVAYQPATTPKELHTQVTASITVLNDWLKEFGFKTLFSPVGKFNLSDYADIEEITLACIAGCNPDKNALIPNYQPEVVNIADWGYRGMGGHVHMSLPKATYGRALHLYQREILRLMTIFAGNVAVLVSTQPELEKIRLERFGHPGSYRTPTYSGDVAGFEYRAPSSAWLNSESSIDMMFKAVETALELALLHREEAQELIAYFLESSVNAVLNHDKGEADSILTTLKII